MKLLHTSDWHAGRLWKGRQRLDELGAVLDHMADHLERHRVRVLLCTGDVFDTPTPPPEAEQLVFGFFRRVGAAGVRSLVIAGNHDGPARMRAWGTLAELVGVTVITEPVARARGGVRELDVDGEKLVVAALPFAPPRTLVTALELGEDPAEAPRRYARGMAAAFEHLAAGFRPGAVNVLLAHTHLVGALLGGSERPVHVEDAWMADPGSLPRSADYVALGHIHRPQRVGAAHYAGSPMQLDFGEAGEEKSFVVVDARAGQAASVERVPTRGGRPLVRVRTSATQLERDAAQLAQAGWLHVTVTADAPLPGLDGRIRRLLPNAVVVELDLPEPAAHGGGPAPAPRPGSTGARELYAGFTLRTTGHAADPVLLDAFDALRAEAERE